MTAETLRRADMLRRLAESVEQLDGPDPLIDLHVRDALHDDDPEAPVSPVTASIDAAAALMPEGWSPEIIKVQHRWRAMGIPSPGGIAVVGFGATEPLARTACALRAIAADIEAKETTHV